MFKRLLFSITLIFLPYANGITKHSQIKNITSENQQASNELIKFLKKNPPFPYDENDALEQIKQLLARGANPNAKENKKTQTPVLILATGQPNMMRLLLNHGANPNIPDSTGFTALMCATHASYNDCVHLLLEYGANPNMQTNHDRENDMGAQTALMLAADCSNIDNIKLLLEHGANPNLQDDRGYTALWLAIRNMNIDIVKLFLQNGAHLNIQDRNGDTPLMEAIFFAAYFDITDGAIDADALMTANPLSTLGKFMKIIQLLLENGADHTIQNNSGETALHPRYARDNKAIVKLILKYTK